MTKIFSYPSSSRCSTQ